MTHSTRRRPSPTIPQVQATPVDGIDFKAVVEAAIDVIILHGPDILATYVSPSIMSLIGRTQAEMVGRCHMEHIVASDMPAVLRTIEAHEKGQMDGRVSFRMMHKNGSTVWVEGSGRVLKNPETGEDSFVVILRDIAERKALEAKLALMALTGASHSAAAGKPAATPGSRPSGNDRDRSAKSRNVN